MYRSQPLEALDQARRIKEGRGDLRRQIRTGRLSIREALYSPYSQTMTVERLLIAQRNWGSHRAGTLLKGLQISPTRRVMDLTDRQRALLIQRLG